MPRSTSSDRVCCPRAMMSCQARRCRSCVLPNCDDGMPHPKLPTVCAVQGRRCHATPDIVRPCVLSKGEDVMPCLMSSDCVCCPKAMMSCHARRCRPCVRSKGGDVMPHVMLSDCACSPRAVMSCHARRRSTKYVFQEQGWHATPDVVRPCVQCKDGDGMSCPTSFERVRCPKVVMSCHAQRRLTVCAAQRR